MCVLKEARAKGERKDGRLKCEEHGASSEVTGELEYKAILLLLKTQKSVVVDKAA